MQHPFRAVFLLLFGIVLLSVTSRPASAASIVVFGTSSPIDASATGTLTLSGNTVSVSLTNTSTVDGRITGLGFDLMGGDFSGNTSTGLNGFAGTSSDVEFLFSDGALGNVPEFSTAVLDFGYTTGNSGSFSGGSANDGLAPSEGANFIVTGNFAGLTEAQVAAALFVRFQRVGASEGSDVGRVGVDGVGPGTQTTTVPEPASMILLGTGLLAALRSRKRHA